MEKAERIYVLPAAFGWSDLGSWGSLHSLLPKDERNNAVVGENVRMYECNNCIVHTPHLKQAVIQGPVSYTHLDVYKRQVVGYHYQHAPLSGLRISDIL